MTVIAALLLHAALLAWQAWRYSPTIDEPAHLIAGMNHWLFGRFDLYRVNPPLVRLIAVLPMLLFEPRLDWSSYSEGAYARPEFALGMLFVQSNASHVFWCFTLCRWMCIPFSLVGGYYCYRWARTLYGGAAGFVALMLWCFCPNVLGNGALMTPDVPAATFGVVAGYHFWRWLHEHTWSRALGAGFALGLAEATKSSWIILFGIWPLLWLYWRFFSGRQHHLSIASCSSVGSLPRAMRPAHRPSTDSTHAHPSRCAASNAVSGPRVGVVPSAMQLCLIAVTAIYVLNLTYGFEKSFVRLASYHFISEALGGPNAHKLPGNRFARTWAGAVPVPLPANYVKGIDVQRFDFEVGRVSYLRGEKRHGGWWYYYLYAMAVKVPAGTLFLIALATVLSTISAIKGPRAKDEPTERRTEGGKVSIRDSVVLLAPSFILITLVSSQTGFNRYLRYVLPAFPFLFVWASQATRLLSRNGNPGPRLAVVAIIAPLLGTIASWLAVFPHSLSYFNELAGGSANGPAHLLDANIDWGQDLLELKHWCDTHPEARPMHLSHSARTFDERSINDVAFVATPFVKRHTSAETEQIRGPARAFARGWYAVGVNELYDYNADGNDRDMYARFRMDAPLASIGYSIRIYHVD